MSFPKYAEYRDSGVEWLGNVPAHWDLEPLKYVSTCNDDVLPESTREDYELEYVEISDVDNQRGITGTTKHIFSIAPSRARRKVKHGDVLISTVRTYLRAIAPVSNPPENLVASTGFAVIRPRQERLDSSLLGYQLRAEWFISEVISKSVGVSYPAINASDLVNIKLPIPPKKEQKKIVAFLDCETFKIDTLVAEQQRLIALLKEKRQALISHAVTKGLNPDAPMRDSGVEWLGEVPAHWDVCKLWMRFELGRGRVISNEEIRDKAGLYPVYSSQTKNNGVLGCVDTYDFEGDYITWTTDGANAGTVSRRSGKFNCTNVCGTLKARSDTINLDYYTYALSRATSWFVRHDINPKLMNNVVAGISIPILPKSEQANIALLLDEQTNKFDKIIEQAKEGIGLLRERRSALISDAVTGKIDLRNWQPNLLTAPQEQLLKVAEPAPGYA